MKRKQEDDNGPDKKRRKIDESLTCSVTKERFVHPVTLLCGHTFEYSAVEKQEKCPLCREEIIMLPKLNYNLAGIIDEEFPGHRESNKYEGIPVNQTESYGKAALKRAKMNQKKLFPEYFEKIKEKFLDGAISYGQLKGKVTNTSDLFYLQLILNRGHWKGFHQFALKNGVFVEITVNEDDTNEVLDGEFEFR